MKLTERTKNIVDLWFRACHEYYTYYNDKHNYIVGRNLNAWWDLDATDQDSADEIVQHLMFLTGSERKEYLKLQKLWDVLVKNQTDQ